MRKMTLRILVIVLLTSMVCVLGITSLSKNLTFISEQYENEISNYVQNQSDMAQISQCMYQMESLLWQHILNKDKSTYDKFEDEIAHLQVEVEERIDRIESHMTDKKDKESLHQLLKSYNGFEDHVDVVYQLSRSHSTQSAQYYVSYNMAVYLDSLRDTLSELNASMSSQYESARAELDASIRRITLQKNVCLVIVICNLLLCIVTVFSNIRKIVSYQTDEQQAHQQRVMALQYNTIVGMANLIESRDGETGEHVKRTADIVQMVANELVRSHVYDDEMGEGFIDNLWKAAPLHDIGKIKVPDAILQKPGKLTKEEFEVIKNHAAEGGRIVDSTMGEIEDDNYLNMARDVARYHHEKWDGTGYPEGRKEKEIPLSARIMAVADVFDALISERCYKKSMSVEEAYQIITESSGTHFDPQIVEAFVRIRPDVEEYIDNRTTL